MICSALILDWLQGMAGDTFKAALYTSAAKLDKKAFAYSAKDEVKGYGYTPGGITLTGFRVVHTNDLIGVDFDDPIWKVVSIKAVRYALIYNATRSNRAVQVVDFGEDKSASNGPFRFYPEDGVAFFKIQS